MANKKINELDSRASLSLSDLMAVGDPSTGYLYKTTISDLKTLTGAGVISFNGRFGAVSPAEGDYNLTQLGDVIITSASNGQVLKFNGSNWVNAAEAGETDTLDSVTDRGNETTNSIIVGSVTAAGLSNLLGQIKTFATTGNVYIGASPTSATDGGYKLDVNGGVKVSADGLSGSNGTVTAPLVKFNTSNLVHLDPQGYGAVTGATLSVGGQLSNNGYLTSTNYHMVKGGSTVVDTPFITYGIGRPDADYSLQPLSGMGGYFAGAAWYNGAGLTFYTSNGTDITGGANLAEAMRITPAGVLRVTNLAGTGSRMVIVDANGVMSTQAIPTGSVTSVFGRTGAVVAESGDYTTSQVTEGTNLYFTNARARAAISLTTTGSSGAATYVDGVLNIPNYSVDLSGYVTLGTAQTISGQKVFSTNLRMATASPSVQAYAADNSTYYGALFINNIFYQFTAAVAGSQWLFKNSAGDNVVTIGHTGALTAASIARTGGTSSQFLKADGSVDSSTYLTTASAGSTYLPLAGGILTGDLTVNSNTGGLYLNRAATTNYAGIVFRTAGVGRWFTGMRETGTGNDFIIYNTPNNIDSLRLNETTGAATFSSSVTAGGSFISNVTNGYGLRLNRAAVTNFNGISHATAGVERWFVGMRENLSSNNYVIYNEATGVDVMTLSSSNNNVGIGTSSPTYARLQVESTGTTSYFQGGNGGYAALAFSGNNGTLVGALTTFGGIIYFGRSNGALGTAFGAQQDLCINSSGNVLINNTGGIAGGGALQVNGDVNINGNFRINGTIIGGGGGSGVTGSGTNGYLTKWTSASTLGNSVIYDNGTNVGIGITNPLGFSKLSLGTGVGAKFLVYDNGSTVFAGIGQDLAAGNSTDFFCHAVSNLGFLTFGRLGTNGSTYYEWARFSASANLLINTTTDLGGGYKLQVNGSISMAYASFFNFRGSSGAGDVLVDNSGSALRVTGSMTVSGSVSASGGFFDTSDYRLKTLIQDNYLANSISTVKAKLYTKNGKQEIGYYAQDLQSILPSAVMEGVDGFLSLSYSQVHTAKIAVIEDEVSILKNRVSELEYKLQKCES